MTPISVFGISTLGSFVSSVIAARLIVWPRLQTLEPNRAITTLVAPHMFLRFIGLSFLVPGVVSPLLPAGFTTPIAYGDLVAGVLAIVTTVALVNRSSWATTSVWLFNLWGTADFLFGFYQGRLIGLHPGMLGPGFYLITAIVPPMLVTHGLIFFLLARREPATAPDRRQRVQPHELADTH